MSVKEAMARISDNELQWWMAYDRISPIGRERADYLNGLLCYIISVIHSKKGSTLKVDDFVPNWSGGGQDPAQMEQALTAFAKLHNKSIKASG